jgi:hypothetical protein
MPDMESSKDGFLRPANGIELSVHDLVKLVAEVMDYVDYRLRGSHGLQQIKEALSGKVSTVSTDVDSPISEISWIPTSMDSRELRAPELSK